MRQSRYSHKIYEQALADPEDLSQCAPPYTDWKTGGGWRRPVSRYCAIHGNDENEIDCLTAGMSLVMWAISRISVHVRGRGCPGSLSIE